MIWWSTNIHQPSQNRIWDSSNETHMFFWTNWVWLNDMALGPASATFHDQPVGRAYVRWNTTAARWNISTPKSWTRTVFFSSGVWFMARTFLGDTGIPFIDLALWWEVNENHHFRSFGLPPLFTLQLWLDSWETTLRNPLASVAMDHNTFRYREIISNPRSVFCHKVVPEPVMFAGLTPWIFMNYRVILFTYHLP